MNAEHRKGLEQNDLAATIEKAPDAVRQGPPRGLVVGVVIATVLVLLFLVWYWLTTSAARNSANLLVALEQMRDGTDIRALDKFAKDLIPEAIPTTDQQTARREQLMVQQLEAYSRENPRSIEGRLGRLRLARMTLYLGERDYSSQSDFLKETAKRNLGLARDTYKGLVTECADSPLLQQEAILNQGRASETLGEFAEALKLYKSLAQNKDVNNPAVELAKAQVKRLEDKAREATAQEIVQKTIGGP